MLQSFYVEFSYVYDGIFALYSAPNIIDLVSYTVHPTTKSISNAYKQNIYSAFYHQLIPIFSLPSFYNLHYISYIPFSP